MIRFLKFSLCIFLIVSLLLSVWVTSVNAFATEAAIAICLGLCLVGGLSVGLAITGTGNLSDCGRAIWDGLQESHRQAMLYQATLGLGTVLLAQEVWEDIRNTAKRLFPPAKTEVAPLDLFGFHLVGDASFPSFLTIPNLIPLDVGYEGSAAESRAIQGIDFNFSADNSRGSVLTINFPNGVSLQMENNTYTTHYVDDTKHVYNFLYPIIRDYDGYSTLQLRADIPFSDSTSYHEVNFGNIIINGTGTPADGYSLSYYNGYVYANGVNGYCVTPVQNQYHNLAHYLYALFVSGGQLAQYQYSYNQNLAQNPPNVYDSDGNVTVATPTSVNDVAGKSYTDYISTDTVVPQPTIDPNASTVGVLGSIYGWLTDTLGSFITGVNVALVSIGNAITSVITNINTGVNTLSNLWSNFWDWCKTSWVALIQAIQAILAYCGSLAAALADTISLDICTTYDGFLQPFQTKLIPFFNNFKNTINSMQYENYVFEDIYAHLFGSDFCVVKLSMINQYLPTVRVWSASIFWIFYAFYVFDELYFLIRGTHALASSIAYSNITPSGNGGNGGKGGSGGKGGNSKGSGGGK